MQNIVTIIIMCCPVPPAASPVKSCKIILREIISVTQEVSCFHNILLGCKLGIAPHFTNCRFTVVSFIFAKIYIWERDPCHGILIVPTLFSSPLIFCLCDLVTSIYLFQDKNPSQNCLQFETNSVPVDSYKRLSDCFILVRFILKLCDSISRY